MDRDLVIGLDSSTSATKAIAWTRDGLPVAEGRSPIPLASPAPNWYEQNPEDWWGLGVRCAAMYAGAGLAWAYRCTCHFQPERDVCCFGGGRPCSTPGNRLAGPALPRRGELAERAGGRAANSRDLGKARRYGSRCLSARLDAAPRARRVRRTAIFADVHGYLTWRLTGRFQTSWASADPLGLFDMQGRIWSGEILRPLDLEPGRLPLAAAPGTVIGCVNESGALATGVPAGTPLVAGGGDGQAAGLGVNALTPGRAYLNLGTAVVAGIHSSEYHIGQAWRTMGSCSGEGYYYETSLRSGTFLIDWFLDNCVGGINGDATRQRLEAEAASVPIGSGGVLAVPYWGAVMTPYWDQDARGCLVGLNATHRAAHLYRALLEGIALEQAMVTGMIQHDTGIQVQEFVAIGGGAASDLWCQIIADACGKPVKRSRTVEASSLGAAMCAATGAGWFHSVVTAAKAMSGAITRETEPCAPRQVRYAELLEIYREVYPELRHTYRKLAHFTAGSAWTSG